MKSFGRESIRGAISGAVVANIAAFPAQAQFNPFSAIKGAVEAAVEGFVDDTVIEGKINALLIDAKGVNVTNFRWRAVQGHVYLFGRALSREELDKAIAVVKGIKDVASVTSRVKVRPKS